MITLLLPSIVQNHIKTPRHCNYQLMEFFVGMATTFGSARHVIKIVNTADIKGYVVAALNKGQITAGFCYFRQLDDSAVLNIQGSLSKG